MIKKQPKEKIEFPFLIHEINVLPLNYIGSKYIQVYTIVHGLYTLKYSVYKIHTIIYFMLGRLEHPIVNTKNL
jgi:hypothetical protein